MLQKKKLYVRSNFSIPNIFKTSQLQDKRSHLHNMLHRKNSCIEIDHNKHKKPNITIETKNQDFTLNPLPDDKS